MLRCTRTAGRLPPPRPARQPAGAANPQRLGALHRHLRGASSGGLSSAPTPPPPFALSASDFVTEHNPNNEQRDRTDQPKALRATRPLAAGEVLHSWSGRAGAAPSHWTLQLNAVSHIDLECHALRHINHACEPNVWMRGLDFVVRRAPPPPSMVPPIPPPVHSEASLTTPLAQDGT